MNDPLRDSIRDDQLRLLFELDADLNRIQDLDILLEEILHGARQTANADAGSIYLVEGNQLQFRYSQNETLEKRLLPGEKLVYHVFSVGIDNRSIAGYCGLKGQTVNIPDAYALPEALPYSFNPRFDRLSHYRTQSILCQPLKTNTGAVVGVLQIINARDAQGSIRAFTADDELLASHFSSSATLAFQRAQLTRTMLLRMTRMAELRDPKETGPHVNRVAGYATEIYRRWAHRHRIDGKETDRLADIFRMAAMLHDVGKVGIDDAILKKPGRLDPKEYDLMKTHTIIGASLFQDAQSEFDAMAAEVTATHHERWDGTGYPVGLAGQDIPLWGRITAVADVYDALSCHRVYKSAWPEDEVLTEIRSQSGRQFDPEILECFFEALPNLKQIFERYPDS
jgi:HD-GYP domain-containing protein (c-di-GMP phosphodiesterase class II)